MPVLASRRGRVLIPAFVVASALCAAGAIAQPKSSIDQARELARDGWKALDEGDFADALDKVTRAEALYHAPTHLLLLGNAQAGLGKLADALDTFERLAAEPLPPGAPAAFKEAQETAKKRVKDLIARVPSVLVVVESAEAVTASVQVDGTEIDLSAGVAMRLNPGEHVITAEAPGYEPAKRSITLPEKGGVVRAPIRLEKKGGAAVAVASSASGAPGASGPTGAPSAAPSGSVAPETAGDGLRGAAYVTLAVGGVGLLAGALTGGLSLSMTGELKSACPDDVCPEREREKLESARALAAISTAGFAIGGAAAAASVVLFVIAPKPHARREKTGAGEVRRPASGEVTISPWISVGGAGLRGSF